MRRTAQAVACVSILATASVSFAASPLLEPVRVRLDAAEARLRDATDPLERAQLLLVAGRHDEAARMAPELAAAGPQEKLLAARILFAMADYEPLRPLVEDLARSAPDSPPCSSSRNKCRR